MNQEETLNLQDLEPGADEQGSTGGAEAGERHGASPRGAHDLEAVFNIPVQVSAILGKATLQVHQLLKLGRGAVIELDRKVGEPVDIYVNNRLVARGEVVVVEERLGITMTEIVRSERG
jgi:flagellar motor switch protein FliN